jgi:hypothetical protein
MQRRRSLVAAFLATALFAGFGIGAARAAEPAAKEAAWQDLMPKDTVWVGGMLKVQRQDASMGASSCRIQGPMVERNVPPARP